MPRRSKHKLAERFQETALRLEKALGLGGPKTDRFIEKLSNQLSPLLENLETTILATQSLPFGLSKKMFQVYLKEIASEAGISVQDLMTVSQDLLKLLREWFRPEEMKGTLVRLGGLLLLARREGKTDEFGMDPALVEALAPLFQFLYEDYWRLDVKGIGNIPIRGRCLLVANHSGGIPFDGSMVTVACLNEHPSHRNVRFLVEDFVYHFPFMGTFMNRLGAVRACPENAVELLKRGNLVLVFPEGVKGLGKLYSERYQLKRFGRGGFIKIAIQTKTPIVPVSVIGAEEIYPIIWKSSLLAKALGIPYLPVTPTFPWLGPAGLIPLPTKWRIQFGKPISFKNYKPAQAEDGLLVQNLTEQVRGEIQKMLADGLKRRKSVWVG
ncbi:MAG: acyltransferase family protein [Deltaproteobacteria bacterium]|nr:acyltransferase family protein [Deltaproteobacteria bacterium]